MSGDAKYSADVAVGITDQGERVVYDMTDIVPADFELKKRIPTIVTTQEAIDYVPGDSFNRILADSAQNVKENFSLNDSTGRELSKGQREYFKEFLGQMTDGNASSE